MSGDVGGFQAEVAKFGAHEGAKAGTNPKKSGDPKNATPRLFFFDSDFSSTTVAIVDRSTICKSILILIDENIS